jgi:hypothetical protein
MPGDGRIRGCCFGAGRLLASLGVDTDGGHAIEATFQAHRREVEHHGEVDYVKLAALHLVRLAEEPTLW